MAYIVRWLVDSSGVEDDRPHGERVCRTQRRRRGERQATQTPRPGQLAVLFPLKRFRPRCFSQAERPTHNPRHWGCQGAKEHLWSSPCCLPLSSADRKMQNFPLPNVICGLLVKIMAAWPYGNVASPLISALIRPRHVAERLNGVWLTFRCSYPVPFVAEQPLF